MITPDVGPPTIPDTAMARTKSDMIRPRMRSGKPEREI